jgi:uncharacterized RDD family membrane protein YckC
VAVRAAGEVHEVVTAPQPAGFWIRAVALAVDLVVFALVQLSLNGMARLLTGPGDPDGSAPPSVALFTLLFTAAYTTVLHVVAGQTIGKSLVGIRVVAVDGGRLTVGPALLRYLAYYASLAALGFGYLMAGLRRDKRALHDLVAATRVERIPVRRRVVRRPVVPRPPPPPAEPVVRPATEPGPSA